MYIPSGVRKYVPFRGKNDKRTITTRLPSLRGSKFLGCILRTPSHANNRLGKPNQANRLTIEKCHGRSSDKNVSTALAPGPIGSTFCFLLHGLLNCLACPSFRFCPLTMSIALEKRCPWPLFIHGSDPTLIQSGGWTFFSEIGIKEKQSSLLVWPRVTVCRRR